MDSIQLPLPHGLGHLMPALCKNTTAHQGNNIISTLVGEQRKEREAGCRGSEKLSSVFSFNSKRMKKKNREEKRNTMIAGSRVE